MAIPSPQNTYAQVKNGSIESLVEQYLPLVKRIAHHLTGRLPPSVAVDDMIQAGIIGLIEASKKFDSSKGASFETFAGIRIRGSMLDEIRKGDWAPRSVHRNARRVTEAIRAVEQRVNRDARDAEIAEELGVSLDDYYQMTRDSLATRLFSIDELTNPSNLGDEDADDEDFHGAGLGPLEGITKESLQLNLTKAIQSLSEREQLILALYYDEELNLKEIGEVLGVSESRVSQIHSQAALKLRAKLEGWRDAL